MVVAADRPAVQVSWHDANAYAAWLSRQTGERYRLPTDEEWALAAGSRFKDDGLPVDDNDPSKRWIARYERESERLPADDATRSFGSFGVNENGLSDLAGNVWEWTSTCFVRTAIERGRQVSRSQNCGVRVVRGTASRLCHRFHPRRTRRRMRRRSSAEQSRLPPGGRARTMASPAASCQRGEIHPHRRLLAQQRLAPSHPLDRALDGRAVEATILQALFEMIGNARHLLLLIEQIVADAEHVHAGLERGKAG